MSRRAVLFLRVTTLALAAMALASCSEGGGGEAAGAEGKLDRVVEIDGERGLYVRCTGAGSPTVVMEAGDESDSYQYNNVEWQVSQETRTCVYDRAGLAATRRLSEGLRVRSPESTYCGGGWICG